MDTRMLLAGLAAGVAGFLLGWLLFGILLMGYFEANMFSYEGLMKSEVDMNMPVLLLGNVVTGLLVAWVCWRTGDTTAIAGLRTGAILGFLVYASFGLFFYSMMNWYTGITVMVVDVLANTLWTAIIGLVAGLVLGIGKKAA
jgi:hypothetical protein